MQRVVNEFLQQLDGSVNAVQRKEGAGFMLVLAATNWPERIDKAVLRPPRFSVRIFVGLPDSDGRRQILCQELGKRAVSSTLDLEDIVRRTEEFSGADVVALVEAAAQGAFCEAVSGTMRPLCETDFEAAFERVRPSVSKADVERYKRLNIQS